MQLINQADFEKLKIDAKPAIKKAEEIKIENISTMETAERLARQIRQAEKTLEEIRKKEVKPLNDKLKTINSFFKTIGNDLLQARKKVVSKITDYEKEQDEKIKNNQAAGIINLVDSILANEKPAAEFKPEIIKPKKSIIEKRHFWDFEIVNIADVPQKYKFEDLKRNLVKTAIKAGERKIPGLRIFERVIEVVK